MGNGQLLYSSSLFLWLDGFAFFLVFVKQKLEIYKFVTSSLGHLVATSTTC
ncbi:MAG: hypothetical protein HLUCCO16_20625 [Phormidium sp. OSCR]|nr:MAG: hypothetical protein HLUCCO16_20625 [Phormidium sp. OSCR]